MSNKGSSFIFPALALLGFTAYSAAFTVPEGFQAVVTQFGEVKGEARRDAGLYFKIPFVQKVRYLDERILSWDGEPSQIPTKDQKVIVVDTTARWRITDPTLFIQKLVDERTAMARISASVTSATRDTISANNLVEAVRNTNTIVERRAKAEGGGGAAADAKLVDLAAAEIESDLDLVSMGRTQLSEKIAERAREELSKFGIELIDVQLQRVAYERSVEQAMFNTMISEQQRIADKFRSMGKGEQAKIQGKTERDLKQIESEAYRKVQEIRGKADADAIKIYAEAIGGNQSFYEFLRTAEAYRKGLRDDTTMILSAEAEFLRLLTNGSEALKQ